MERQKKVLDASVILKIFTHEVSSEKALLEVEEHTKGNIDIIVPELIFLEVINGLRYKRSTEEKLIEANKKLYSLELKVEKTNSFIINKAIEIAIKYNITIYDAIYVSIAQLHGCQLITADSALFKIPNVIPLEKV